MLNTAAGAHHFRFLGIEFARLLDTAFIYDLVAREGTRKRESLDLVPHHLVLIVATFMRF